MKPKSALVSIIIPVFNQTETYMRECLESVFRQSHDNIEIVISDNHSTNGIGNYLANVSNQNQKIKLVKPDTFISMIENFIYAFKHASGDFLCPLSSDDIIFPDHVETLLSGFYRELNLAFSCSAPLFFKQSISEKWVPNVYNTGFYEGHSFAQLCLKYPLFVLFLVSSFILVEFVSPLSFSYPALIISLVSTTILTFNQSFALFIQCPDSL